MNQLRFNKLIDQFIKTKAAKIVTQTLSEKGAPKLNEFLRANDIKVKLANNLAIQQQEMLLFDKKIESCYKQISQSKTPDLNDEKRQEELELLQIKKSFLISEILFKKNELIQQTRLVNQLLADPEQKYFLTASKLFSQEKALLINMIKESIIIYSHQLVNHDENTINIVINDMLIENLKTNEFSGKLNYFFNCHFEYNLSYRTLLEKIAVIINSSYWEHWFPLDKVDDSFKKMRNILSQTNRLTDEEVYVKLKAFAQQILEKSSVFFSGTNKGIELLNFCNALINDDLITFEAITLKIDILHNQKITPKQSVEENVQLKLFDNLIKTNITQQPFNALVDNYLLLIAANLIVEETVKLTHDLHNELVLLINNIKTIENNISTFRLEKECFANQAKETDDRFAADLEKYPSSSEIITEKHQKKINSLSLLQDVSNYDIKNSQSEMHKLIKEYNNKILENNEKFRYCATLTNFAAVLEHEFMIRAGSLLKLTDPIMEKSTIEFVTENILLDITHEFHDKPFTERLNHVIKSTNEYSATYQDFNQRLLELATHSYLQILKKNGHNIKNVQEIAKLLKNETHLSPKQCFELVQQKAVKLTKYNDSIWNKNKNDNIPTEAQQFFKAIAKQDMLSIDKLRLQFDFPAPNANKQLILRNI